MAKATNKYLLGGSMKLLFSGRMTHYLREIKIWWGGFYWGGIFPGGKSSKFSAGGLTPPIFLVGKTLVDKSFLQ